MTAVIIILVIALVGAVAAGAWFYVQREKAKTQHREGSGLAAIARGLLAAYTGGMVQGLGGDS